MKHTPDEKQIEELLENFTPNTSGQLDLRLSNAPWTPRAVARRRIVNITAIAALTFALLVAATPQGRAFAQSILQFFIRSESNIIPVPTGPTEEPFAWVDVTPGTLRTPSAQPTYNAPMPAAAVFGKDCGDYGNPSCTVEQIRNKVNFTVRELGKIPEGIYFIGATGGPDSIFLSYGSQDQSSGLVIYVERWMGNPSPETDIIGASATVEKVQIGNLTGEYFKGSFAYKDGEVIATWDPSGIETLRWADDGTSYKMQYFSQTPFGKEGMVALAESMTLEPVSKLPKPTPEESEIWDPREFWNLSVPEAEQQTGFKLILPSKMPEILSLFGANYDAKANIVGVYYRLEVLGMPPNSDGLVLRQQVAPNSSGCALCDILVEDSSVPMELDPLQMTVPPNSNLEIVQIGTVTGKYVEGGWHHPDGCCYAWDPEPYFKTLRWWVDGRAFELSYMGMDIEKEDMIKIAESMQ